MFSSTSKPTLNTADMLNELKQAVHSLNNHINRVEKSGIECINSFNNGSKSIGQPNTQISLEDFQRYLKRIRSSITTIQKIIEANNTDTVKDALSKNEFQDAFSAIMNSTKNSIILYGQKIPECVDNALSFRKEFSNLQESINTIQKLIQSIKEPNLRSSEQSCAQNEPSGILEIPASFFREQYETRERLRKAEKAALREKEKDLTIKYQDRLQYRPGGFQA